MTRRNAKTVLRTAVSRNATAFTLLNAAKVMMALFFMAFIACAKEDLKDKAAPAAVGPRTSDSVSNLQKYWDKSVKSLVGNATPHDTMCYSWTEFAQQSIMKYSTQDGVLYSMNFAPEITLEFKVTPGQKEVKTELEIPTYLTHRSIVYDYPINEGLYLGRKFNIQDQFADGSQVSIEATWKCLGIITNENDTVLPPHLEYLKDLKSIVLDSIHVEKMGEWTALDKPHKLIYCYSTPLTSKGVSDAEKTMKVQNRPWLRKDVTDDPQMLTGKVTYTEKWIGCPVTAYELTQTAPTNKGTLVNTYKFPVSMSINIPELREQPSLDSLFAEQSTKSNFKCEVLGDSTTTADGFVGLTYTGQYGSKNMGKENSTSIESSATFTYTVPVKFSNQWGSYDITAPKLSFEEGGFEMKSESEDEDYHVWLTTNTILPKFGTCELDAIDELVRIKVGKDKAEIWVDSTFVKSVAGDVHTIDAKWYGSKGSTRTFTWSYVGHHSASAKNFGEKITSSLNWNASGLKANGTSKDSDRKEFTPDTYFEAVYVTTEKISNASNGAESGIFSFSETHPTVKFVHGETVIEFDERPVVLTAQAPEPAANYNVVVRDGKSYKGYTYNMSCGVVYDGVAEDNVVSQGMLLVEADEVGEPQYGEGFVWNSLNATPTVTRTIPHSLGDPEVYTYTVSYAVLMTALQNGKVYADNTAFGTKVTNSEKSLDEIKDGFFTIKPRQRDFTYVVTNGAVERQMTNTVIDVVIEFNDGTYRTSFNGQLNVNSADNFGEVYTEGVYKVTPLTTAVTAVAQQGTNAPTLTENGVTSIYVEQDQAGDPSYKDEEAWSNTVFTAKVLQTIPHSKANPEVKEFTKSVTVSMSDLSDGRVDADNTNFGTTGTSKDSSTEDKDGVWTVKKRVRNYTYVISNGAIERQMTNEVVDYEIVFNDGTHTHTFNAQLNVSSSDKFGKAYDEGSYRVTPLTTTVTAVASGTNAPTLTKTGTTNIYIKNIPVQYRLRGEFIEEYNENSYFNVYAEKSVDGGETWTEMDVMKGFVAERHGKWAPNVTAQVVTSYEFTTHDTTKSWALEEPQTGRGTNKRFDVINVSHIEYFWKSLFPAPLDADRNDKRNISGTQKQWVNKLIYHNPETGEPMTYEVDARLETTTHTVKDGVYTRIVSVYCQNQIVESQVGTVVLELVQ